MVMGHGPASCNEGTSHDTTSPLVILPYYLLDVLQMKVYLNYLNKPLILIGYSLVAALMGQEGMNHSKGDLIHRHPPEFVSA